MRFPRTPALVAAALAASLTAVPAFAADGDLDPTFGLSGIAYLTPDDVSARGLWPFAATTLPDGKLLFAGQRDIPTTVPFEQNYRGMLARLNADGSPDDTFGNNTIPGVVVLDDMNPGARMEGVETMAVLADGSIVVGGVAMVDVPLKGFIAKLDSEGNRDPSFGGGNGVVLFPSTYVHALAVDSEGRIVAAGEHVDAGVYTGTVVRLLADGTPDPDFGDAGSVALTWDGAGYSSNLTDLKLDAAGAIYAAGTYSVYGDGLGGDYAVAKLDSTGALDPSFAGTGWRVFHDETDTSMVNGLARIGLTPDGGVAFTGYYLTPDGATALIIGKLLADGSIDAAFGDPATPGFVRPPLPPETGSANPTALLVQPDGKILVGTSYFPPSRQLFLAYRTTAAGQLDASFADNGTFSIDLAPDGVYNDLSAMTLQPDLKIVMAGRVMRSADSPVVDMGIVRLLNGGIDDRIFASSFDE